MAARKKKPGNDAPEKRARSVTHSVSMSPEQRAELDAFIESLGFRVSRSEVIALIALDAMDNPRPLELAPRQPGAPAPGDLPEQEVGDSFGVSMAPSTAKRIDETIAQIWGEEVSRATWYQAIIARAIREGRIRIYPKGRVSNTGRKPLPKRVGQATPKRRKPKDSPGNAGA
jgi:hypothetical protein